MYQVEYKSSGNPRLPWGWKPYGDPTPNYRHAHYCAIFAQQKPGAAPYWRVRALQTQPWWMPSSVRQFFS